MSEGNVEIVRRAWGAFERGDLTGAVAPFAEDVVSRRVPPIPDPASYEGRAGVLDLLFDWIEGFEEFDQALEELLDEGESVIARIRQRAQGARSGVPVEGVFWFLFGFRGAEVARFEIYADKEQALAAA